MKEIQVSFQSDVDLSGTLALPEGHIEEKYPAVLLLHGSGPLDRNENTKFAKMNVFKLLSDSLCENGFAVLRYDKRGVGESKGNFYEAGLYDFVSDAEAAFAFLKTHPNIDPSRIFLLGHSEGCTLAVLLQLRQKARGLILLAGACESLKTTIIRQGEQASRDVQTMSGWKGTFFRLLKIPEKIAKQQAVLFDRIERSSQAVIRVKGQKIPAKWLREHFQYNVFNDLPKITCPVLAITGSKDVQVLPEHARIFAENVSGVSEFHIIENMNHILRYQEGEINMLTLKQTYKRLFKQPLDQRLIEDVVSWLNKTKE